MLLTNFSTNFQESRFKIVHGEQYGFSLVILSELHRFLLRQYFRSPFVAKRRDGTRSVASPSFSLSRYSFSLNKLEADILQGRPGQLHKKTRLHTCGNSPRPSFPLGLGPLSTPACFHFSLPRERHPAVMCSFTLLADVTMSFCSRGKPLHFLSHRIHTLPL